MNETNRDNYNSIDLMKFIMSFAVVAMHTRPLINCKSMYVIVIVDGIIFLATPFFFLASGYLLAKQMEDSFTTDIKIIEEKVKKFIKLYTIWMLIYSPLAIYKASIDNTGFLKGIWIFIRGLLFIGEQYNSWHLWYLLSSIYSFILIIFLMKLQKKHLSKKNLLIIGICFSILSIGINIVVLTDIESFFPITILQKLLSKTIITGRIFTGMVYIPLGMFIAQEKRKINFYFTFMLIGFLSNCLVNNLLLNEILLIITSVGLFGTVLHIKIKDKNIFPTLRKLSISIYFIHMYIWTIYYKIAYGEKKYGLDSFIITIFISVISSYLYLKIKQRVFKTKSL